MTLASAVRRLSARQPLLRGVVLLALLAGLLPAAAAAGTSLLQVDWTAVVAADPRVTPAICPPLPSDDPPRVCVEITPDTIVPGPRQATVGYDADGLGSVAADHVLYGDLAGDGDEEAVVPLSGGYASWSGFLVYRAGANGPQLVTSAAGSDLSLQIAGGALQVSRPGEDRCALPAVSCPSTVVTTSYHLADGALVATQETEQPLAQYLGVPPEVLALLPQGSDLRAGLAADVTDDGVSSWVLFYEVPSAESERHGEVAVDAHLSIISAAQDGWEVAGDFTVESRSVVRGFYLAAPNPIDLIAIAGTPAVVCHGYISGHGMMFVVVRWDGTGFQQIFQRLTEREPPALQLQDLDGNGVPAVVDREPSMCVSSWGPPDWLAVYRWDGATFTDATEQYPALLNQTEADAQAMLVKVASGEAFEGASPDYIASEAPRVTACLHALLAVLDARGGDTATAAAECGQAQAAAQDQNVFMAAMQGLPGASEVCRPDGGGSQ